MDTTNRMSPAMQEVIKTAVSVCDAWTRRPRDNVVISANVKKLQAALVALSSQEVRQPFSEDPRQHGGI